MSSSRQKTTAEIAQQFKIAFSKCLGSRLDPPVIFSPDVPNDVLCSMYEKLPAGRKRGIWPDVGHMIGRDEKWSAKHYTQCFKKALYPDEFTQDQKSMITQLIQQMWEQEQRPKAEIVKRAKELLSDTRVFPGAIQSYVFQGIERLELLKAREFEKMLPKVAAQPVPQQRTSSMSTKNNFLDHLVLADDTPKFERFQHKDLFETPDVDGSVSGEEEKLMFKLYQQENEKDRGDRNKQQALQEMHRQIDEEQELQQIVKTLSENLFGLFSLDLGGVTTDMDKFFNE